MLASRPFQHLQNHNHLTAKTPGRENAAISRGEGPKTVHGKGRQGLAGPSQKDLTRTAPRLVTQGRLLPLGDKTPFPNQAFVTPLPGEEKIAKLNLALGLENPKPLVVPVGRTPDSVLRPSSARRHGRTPRISGGALAGRTSFVTPLNSGRHWDVSEGDIAVGTEEAAADAEEKDDYDEIEYMPPKLNIPYVPPLDFDLPNYAEAGKALLARIHSFPLAYDDEGPPPDLDIPVEDLQCACDLPLPDVPFDLDLDLGDPFVVKPASLKGRTPGSTSTHSRAASTSRAAATTSRPATRPRAPVPASVAGRPAPAARKPAAVATTTTLPAKRPAATTTTTKSTRSATTTTSVTASARMAAKAAVTAKRPASASAGGRPGVTATSHSRIASRSVAPAPGSSVARSAQLGGLRAQSKKPTPVVDDFAVIVPVGGEVEEEFLFDV
ncbi:hypothetical protein C8F01DRAFT_1256313 [Mycena amicta]|nr:hypothetical protein C8F01DRAFT_1256313 [Mycena amicta]